MGLPPGETAKLRASAESGVKQRSLYKLLMESLYDAVLITDGKGRIIDGNGRAAELFGVSEDDLWDLPASKLILGLNDAIYERIRGAVGGDRFVLMNTRCIRKDGSRIATEVGVSVVDLLGHNNFVFTVRNIERRVAQQRQLQAGQNAYWNAQAGCFLCDARHAIVSVNPAFVSLLGFSSAKEVVGRQIDTVLPVVGECFVRVAAGESMEVEGPPAEGAAMFSIRISPNRQGSSHIDGIVGSLLPAQSGG